MIDVQLLERYVAGQDEAAFRALVVRHGPAVLRVCRRALRDPHEVEDAFQATFLVLVRKAATLRDPGALGSWLHGVAHRVATRAGRDAMRRRHHEGRRAAMDPSHDARETPWDDLGRALREELDRLPPPYRAPLELCYLRGLGHEEAAAELGWPLGTLKARLVRGRRRLRDRLDRRGLALGLGLLLLLRPRRAPAEVPGRLIDSTVEAMAREASARAAHPQAAPAPRDAWGGTGPARRPRWFWPSLMLLGLMLATAGGVAFLGRARAAEFDEFASLPPNLTDVLNVECR